MKYLSLLSLRSIKNFPLKATLAYIGFIVVVNILFVYLPFFQVWGQTLSPCDFLVGFIYVFRDFAQREIKHYIFIAMLIGSLLSYMFANETLALASVSAFIVGELIDWAVFTFTRRPLSKRLLYSAVISAPVDSLVFLYVMGRLQGLEYSLMTAAKILGVMLLWFIWKIKQRQDLPFSAALQSNTK